jgi:hypothetical protein
MRAVDNGASGNAVAAISSSPQQHHRAHRRWRNDVATVGNARKLAAHGDFGNQRFVFRERFIFSTAQIGPR